MFPTKIVISDTEQRHKSVVLQYEINQSVGRLVYVWRKVPPSFLSFATLLV